MATNQDEKPRNTPVEQKGPESIRKPKLDEVWPVHPTAVWPQGLSLRREDIYTDRM